MVPFRPACLAAVFAIVSACATTETPKTPEQAALEQQHDALMVQKAELDQKLSTVGGKGEALFRKASQLEAKLKMGPKRSLAAVPQGTKAPPKGGTIGPLSFARKSASFSIQESGPGSSKGLSIHPLDIKVLIHK